MLCIIVYPAVIEVSESFTHQKLRTDELLCLSRSSGNHVPIVGMSVSKWRGSSSSCWGDLVHFSTDMPIICLLLFGHLQPDNHVISCCRVFFLDDITGFEITYLLEVQCHHNLSCEEDQIFHPVVYSLDASKEILTFCPALPCFSYCLVGTIGSTFMSI
jgi:hypothetical protein